MRYIKVLLLVLLFFLVMMFFVQNQPSFSQTMPLKLDLLFLPPMESAPLPFYTLLIICFVLGGLCVLTMLIWDRITLSAKLAMTTMRVRSLEKELTKVTKDKENAHNKIVEVEAQAKAAIAEAEQKSVPIEPEAQEDTLKKE